MKYSCLACGKTLAQGENICGSACLQAWDAKHATPSGTLAKVGTATVTDGRHCPTCKCGLIHGTNAARQAAYRRRKYDRA